MKKKEKGIIGLQMDLSTINRLTEIAYDDGRSLSCLIRYILKDYVNNVSKN